MKANLRFEDKFRNKNTELDIISYILRVNRMSIGDLLKPEILYRHSNKMLDDTSIKHFEALVNGTQIKEPKKLKLDLVKKFTLQLKIIVKRFKKYTWNAPILHNFKFKSRHTRQDKFKIFSRAKFFRPFNAYFEFYEKLKDNFDRFCQVINVETYSGKIGLKNIDQITEEGDLVLFGELDQTTSRTTTTSRVSSCAWSSTKSRRKSAI